MLLSDKIDVTSSIPDENLIINGNFRIQYHDDRDLLVRTISTYGDYACDRWQLELFGVGPEQVNFIESDGPPISSGPDGATGSKYSLQIKPWQVTAPAANMYGFLTHVIEGYVFRPAWAVGSGTLSFWVKSNKPGIYCVSFRNGNSDLEMDRSFVHEYTINQADTWEKKSVTIYFNGPNGPDPGSSNWSFTTGRGLSLGFQIAKATSSQYMTTTPEQWVNGNRIFTANQTDFQDNTNNYIQFDQVKFEPGEQVTPFIVPDIDKELNRCQRYFEHIKRSAWNFMQSGGNDAFFSWQWTKFNTQKRVTPTMKFIEGEAALFGQVRNVLDMTKFNSPQVNLTGAIVHYDDHDNALGRTLDYYNTYLVYLTFAADADF